MPARIRTRPTARKVKGAVSKAGKVRRILNCVPSRNTENDWQFEHALMAGLTPERAPPPSIDLREPWWKIGDQGSTGSCVGWACADSVLRWHLAKANRLHTSTLLSTRFTWMAAKETDEFLTPPTTFIEAEGTSLKAALDISRKYGTIEDRLLPFGAGTLYQGDPREFFARAATLKIASYVNLGRDLTHWRRWISENGPILTRLDVDRTWDEADNNNGNLGIYDASSARGGHAVALVGYDQSGFIVRNSWGVSWANKGFAFASNGYASDAFTEAYGVTSS